MKQVNIALFLLACSLVVQGCWSKPQNRLIAQDLIGFWKTDRDQSQGLARELETELYLREGGAFELSNVSVCWRSIDSSDCKSITSYSGSWRMMPMDNGRFYLILNLNQQNDFRSLEIETDGSVQLISYLGDPDSNDRMVLSRGR